MGLVGRSQVLMTGRDQLATEQHLKDASLRIVELERDLGSLMSRRREEEEAQERGLLLGLGRPAGATLDPTAASSEGRSKGSWWRFW